MTMSSTIQEVVLEFLSDKQEHSVQDIKHWRKILLKIQKQIVDFLSKAAYNLYRNILLLSTVTYAVLSTAITKW